MTAIRVRGLVGAVVASATLLLTACGDQTATSDTFVGRTYASTGVVENAEPRDLVPGTELLLTFTGDGVIASAGCNQMSGPGRIEDGILAVQLVTTTEIGCSPELAEQEQWWAQFLQSGPSADVGDRALTLRTETSSVVMSSVETVPDLPLEGTEWTLETLIQGETSATAGASSSLLLAAGEMTVSVAECRRSTVPVQQTATSLRFDPQPFAEQPCGEGEAAADGAADAAVDAAIRAVFGGGEVTYRIEADRLVVTAQEQGLAYRG